MTTSDFVRFWGRFSPFRFDSNSLDSGFAGCAGAVDTSSSNVAPRHTPRYYRFRRSILVLALLLWTSIGLPHTVMAQSDSVTFFEPTEVQPLPEERHRELIEQLNYDGKPPKEKKKDPPKSDDDLDSVLNREEEESSTWTLPTELLYGLLIVMASFLAFFVYRMVDFIDKRRQLPAEKEAARVDIDEIQEDQLNVQQTESLLTRAERHEQFDLAVRLQYLALLKQLDEAGMIHFKKDKINRAYVQEMDETPYGDDFFTITNDFERNWYGRYPLDRLSYRLIAEKFRLFRQQIKPASTPDYV